MFTELLPLLKERTVMLIIASIIDLALIREDGNKGAAVARHEFDNCPFSVVARDITPGKQRRAVGRGRHGLPCGCEHRPARVGGSAGAGHGKDCNDAFMSVAQANSRLRAA